MTVNILRPDDEVIIDQLNSTFKHIELDQNFVRDLKEKLLRQPLVVLEARPKAYALLIISSGLLFGLIIFWILKNK